MEGAKDDAHAPEDLAEALAGYGRWVGLRFPRRAPLWVERLGINGDEIALFRAAATPAGPAYVATAIVPAPPRSPHAGSQPAACAPRMSAAQSLAAAKARPELTAFTRFPEHLEPQAPGYLRGVPFAVKDLIGVAGLPLSGGSRTGSSEPVAEDAAAVAAMKAQGAVFVGLANLHELAFGGLSNNPVFGHVVNPACPQRIPGGSSGGSASAVAAGIVDIALATDTAGSIRIPAACCGVVGFKPSYDAVSRDGVLEMSASLDHVGPIGRTVEDCARAFAALSSLATYPGLSRRTLSGVRVGVLGGYFQAPLDPEVRDALTSMQAALRKDGAVLHNCQIEGIELAAAIQFMTISTEAATAQSERLRDQGELLGEDVRVRLEMASLLPGHWYLKAQRLRRQLVANIAKLFEAADVLLCPTMRVPAPLIGESGVRIEGRPYPLHTALSNLTLPFSLSGSPALAMPWGASKAKAPLSMQLASAAGEDWMLLDISKRIAELAPEARA